MKTIDVPKHCYVISFQKAVTLTAVLKEPTTDKGKNEGVLCPRLEPLVEFDLQKDNQTCQEINEDVGT